MKYLLVFMVFVLTSAAVAADSEESQFLAENDTAMTTMMAGMAIKPSGDIDRDFAEMMIPHHQGAIDMARAQLKYGRNEQLRRIAQEIIVTQTQEIAVMRLAIGQPLTSPPPVPDRSDLARSRNTESTTSHSNHLHQGN